MVTRGMSNFPIVVVITRGKLSLGMPPTFLESRDSNIGCSKFFTDVFPSISWTTNISYIFRYMVPLDVRFARGAPLVMAAIYGRFLLLVSLLLPLVHASAVFEGDFPLRDSSHSLLPPFTYSINPSLLISPSMISFSWMH